MLRGRVLDWRVCFGYCSAWWLWSVLGALSMEMDIRLDSVSPRSEAPIPVTVTLKGDRATMEGRLRIRLMSGRDMLLDHTTEPIVVSNSAQERRFLLPPITRMHRGQGEWRLTFETASERVDVRNLLVNLSGGDRERVAVVALVHPDETKPPVALRDVLGQGRLESLMGYDGETRGAGPTKVITWPAYLKPEQLPAQALWLSAYDIVVLAPAALADLSVFQVQGLKTWIRGGGSLLISRHPDHRVPSTAPLSEFLQELSLKGHACEIVPPVIQQNLGVQLETWRWDLGRVAVLDGLEIATDSDAPQWRLLFCFLWDVRILGEVERSLDRLWNVGGLGYATSAGSSNQFTSNLRRGLESRLMPESVRLLPVGQLSLILLGFIALVGPVEYFILKRLRRRWLTWILFPLATVAVTYGSFFTAESLLGRDSTKSLAMIDLSADGKEAVRQSEAELVFSRTSRRLSTSYQDTFVLPVRLSSQWDQPGRPTYSGSFPKDYQMERLAERWTPYMERRTGFAQGVTVPEVLGTIDWRDYHSSAMPLRKEAQNALRDRLAGLEELRNVSRIRTPTERSGLRWPKLFEVGPTWQSSGLPARYHRNTGGPNGNGMNAAEAVPFPRLNSLRGDTFLNDWILVDHEHWLITVSLGDQQIIYRYIYPVYAE